MKFWGGGAPESKLLFGKKINRLHADYKNDKKNIILGNKEVSMKKAFTLAEVLITIGIIGLVAAMTLPSLINKINDKQNIAKWKKEYSVISNAFSLALAKDIKICNHTQYGHCNGQAYTNEFIEHMKNSLNVIDYCGVSPYAPSDKACDNYNSDWYKKHAKYKWSGVANIYSQYKALGVRKMSNPNSYSPYGINAYNFNRLALLLNDGAVVYFGEVWSGPWIVVDVNNFQNGPNEFGRDVFVIRVSSDIQRHQHHITPAGSEIIYKDRDGQNLNNPNYGITGCSAKIGKQTSDNVYEVAGSGCSAKYLLE